jgi:hypothetical protein
MHLPFPEQTNKSFENTLLHVVNEQFEPNQSFFQIQLFEDVQLPFLHTLLELKKIP